jgi:hypothetical protein
MKADLIIREDEKKEYVLKCSESEARLFMLALISLYDTTKMQAKISLICLDDLNIEQSTAIIGALIQSANMYNQLMSDWAMKAVAGASEIEIPEPFKDLFKKIEELTSKLN